MKQEMDVANEPVDLSAENEFMDTGVLHQDRICRNCTDRAAKSGHSLCLQCLNEAQGQG